MNFSARTLAVVLLTSSMLSGCFDSSEKHEWQVEPQGTQSQFPIPQKVQEKVEVENLRAEVQLNNGEWQPLVIDGATARGSLTGLEAGKYTISIRFEYISGIYGPLTLAQATKSVTIVAGTKTTLEVLETDYDLSLFDADRDGFSNADEISMGTNPFDASDPGITPPASSSASSIPTPSSVADSSSSDSPDIDSSSQGTESSSSSTTVSSSSSDPTGSNSSNNNNPIDSLVVEAGDNISVEEGSGVTLNGTAQFTSGSPTYLWEYIGDEPFNEPLVGADTDTLQFTSGNYLENVTFEFRLTVSVGNLTNSDTVLVTITADNDPPVVRFLPDQISVSTNEVVDLIPTLDDPEGAELSLSWQQLLGDTLQVPLAVSSRSARLTTPQLQVPDQPVTLTYELTVSDGVNESTARVAVVVTGKNEPPIARISTVGNQTLFVENTLVTLSAENSSDDYTPASRLTYQWVLETPLPYELDVTDWQSRALSFTAPNLAVDQDLRFSLVVTDDSTPKLSSTKTFSNITIDAENNPAVLSLTRSAGSAEPGEQGITLTAAANDPDLDQADVTYTFEWLNPAGFDVLNATTGEQVTFDAPSTLLEDTDLIFTVNATQLGVDALPIDSDTISVRIGGFVPPTAAAALANAMVTPSEAAAFDVTAAGSLNGTNPITRYSWTTDCDGDLTKANTQVATFTPNNRAANDICAFTVEVSDGSAEGTVSDELNVTITAIDEPPTLAALAEINAVADQVVTLDASAANDPENAPLSFNWSTTSAVAITGGDTATASFTVPNSDVAQTLVFTVTIGDGNPDNTLERNVTVQVAANNDAPVAVITSPSDSVRENTLVTLSGETSNDTHTASDALSYQWEQISPTVAEFDLGISDWQSSTLSFTSPDLAANVVATFGLVVTDEQNTPSVQDTFALTLEGENSQPTAVLTASQNSVGAGVVVTLTAVASNPDRDQQGINYTYNWIAPAGFDSLLAGLSAAELASNQITFTAPTESVQLVFGVTATEDIAGGLTSEAATTTVNVTLDYVPPVADVTLASGGSTITEGIAATFSAATSQLGTAQPVTYAWASTCPGQFNATDIVAVEFTADNLAANVDCAISVEIDDQSGSAAVPAMATLPVTLSAKNDAPVATGPAAPIAAIPNMPVVLAGFSVSDVDTNETELTYAWTADVAGAEAWLSDTTALAPTLLARPSPEDVQVIYTLRALDGGEAERTAAENATAIASVTVNIANNNDDPRAAVRLVMPESVTEIGESMTVQLVAEPVVGATRFDNFSEASELTFTWTPSAELQALGVMPASASGLDAYSFSLPNLEQPVAGLNVSLVIRDPDGGISSTYDFPFAIKAENDEPEVTVSVSPQTANENQTVTFTAVASDPEDIRTLSYRWQQVAADGSPVAVGFEPQVSCNTPASAECSFSAPFVADITPIYMAVTIREEGSEPFLREATEIASVELRAGYKPWVVDVGFVTDGTQGPETIFNVIILEQGNSPIAQYDWSESSCLDADFTGESEDTLSYVLPSDQATDYSCEFVVKVTDAAGVTVNASTVISMNINDLPVAAIADRPSIISGSNPDDPSDEVLDGSGSSDDENDALIYVWEQEPTDAVQVTWLSRGENDGVAFFSVGEQAQETALNFTLTVCDAPNDPARCDATPATITLTVSPTNYPPVAQIQVTDAVFDQADNHYVAQETEHPSQRELGEGEQIVNLSGAGSSDPAPADGTLNFAWSVRLDESEAALDLGESADLQAWAQTHFNLDAADWSADTLELTMPNLLAPRNFVFTLTVTDGGELTDEHEVVLRVDADNDAPVVTANSDVGSAEAGSPISLSATALEPDYEQAGSSTFTYLWSATPAVVNFNGNETAQSLQVTAPELSAASAITFSAAARNEADVDGPEGVSQVVVNISQGYFPPDVTAINTDIAEPTEDDLVTLSAIIENNTSPIASITWQASDCAGAVITPINANDVDVANGASDARRARVQLPNRVEQTYACEITVEVADSSDPVGTDSRAITFASVVAGNDTPDISNVTAVLQPANGDGAIIGELSADILDPEGLLQSYSWEQIPAAGEEAIAANVTWISGNTGTVDDLNERETKASFSISAAQPADVNLQFVIKALDGVNEASAPTQVLTISSTNSAPLAGDNSLQTVNESEYNEVGVFVANEVTLAPLDLTAPLDDFTANEDLEFTWVPNTAAQAILDIPALSLNEPSLTFTLPNLLTSTGADQDIQDLSFELIVNDGALAASSNHVVSITADNDQPVVTSITDAVTVNAGQPAALSVSAIDPEGAVLNYRWREVGNTNATDARFIGATSAQATFTPDAELTADTNYELEVLVWDADSTIDQAAVAGPVIVTATSQYQPPSIALTQITETPREAETVQFSADVTVDAQSTNPTFDWVASCDGAEVPVSEGGQTPNGAGGTTLTVSITAPFEGKRSPYDCTISVTVDDGITEPVVEPSPVFSVEAVDNPPSVTVPEPLTDIISGMPFNFNASEIHNGAEVVTDTDTPLVELTYSWQVEEQYRNQVSVAPAGAELAVTWPTNLLSSNTDVTFTLTVSDGNEQVETPFVFTVLAVNNPPVAVITDEGGATLATSEAPDTIGTAELLETEWGDAPNTLTLSAVNSTDDFSPEALEYQWTVGLEESELAAYGLTLSDLLGETLTITAPNLLADNNFDVSLQAVNTSTSNEVSQLATVTVRIVADNDDPQITAVPQIVTALAFGSPAQALTVQAQDPEGGALTYSWERDTAFADGLEYLSATDIANPDFTVPLEATDIIYGYVVTVTDTTGNFVQTGTIEVPVAGSYTAPTVTFGNTPSEVNEGVGVNIELVLEYTQDAFNLVTPDNHFSSSYLAECSEGDTDANRDALGIRTLSLSVNEALRTWTFTSPLEVGDLDSPATCRYTFEYNDFGGNGRVEINTPDIRFIPSNEAPTIPSIGGPSEVSVGSGVTLTALGSVDPEGEPLTYRWQEVDANGTAVNGGISCPATTENSCSFNAPNLAGPIYMQAIVSDQNSQSESEPFLIEVALEVPLNPPEVIYNGGSFAALEGSSITEVSARFPYEVNTFGSGDLQVTTSNENIASIDETVPAVVINGPGEVVISFTELANSQYQESSISYTLTVPEPRINVLRNSVAIFELSGFVGDVPIEYTTSVVGATRFPPTVIAESSNENVVSTSIVGGAQVIVPGPVAGRATLTFTLDGYPGATQTVIPYENQALQVPTAPPEITALNQPFDDMTILITDPAVSYVIESSSGSGVIKVESGNPDVITVDEGELGGTLQPQGAGTAVITFTELAGNGFEAGEPQTFTLTVSEPSFDIRVDSEPVEQLSGVVGGDPINFGIIGGEGRFQQFGVEYDASVVSVDIGLLQITPGDTAGETDIVFTDLNYPSSTWTIAYTNSFPAVTAQIIDAPSEIFDASFDFPVQAEASRTEGVAFEWQSNHPAITINNPTSLTDASLTIGAGILEGIERGSEAGRNITLSLIADGEVVDTRNMRIVLPFVTVWDTNADTPTDWVTISTSPDFTYDFSVDWGDGVYRAERFNATHQHPYGVDENGNPGGEFVIKITGEFPKFVAGEDAIKLVSIERWGDQVWQDFSASFSGVENLRSINAPDTPDLSQVTKMNNAFAGMALNQSIITANLSGWDVSGVEDFSGMFASANFNGDISGWKTRSAKLMSGMFIDSSFNGDISLWETGAVETMSAMFADSDFDGDISSWDISSIQFMSAMFSGGALSKENYDALLIGWSQKEIIPRDVDFGAGNIQFSSVAESARNALINDYGWTIFDGGLWQPVSVQTPDPVDGGTQTTFTVTPAEGSQEVTSYNWSRSTCPDGSEEPLSILSNVTENTTGSVTFTPPNFGSVPFVCDMRVEITYADTTTAMFTYELMVSPSVSAQIIQAPSEIFDASFAFDVEASVTGVTPATNFEWVTSNVNWGPDHGNITFENVQLSADGTSVTAKMRVSESALNGIDRSTRDEDPNKVRVVTLDLQADGQSVLSEPAEMRIVLPFVTVWDTTPLADNFYRPISAAGELQIGTNTAYTYDYLVDWGDGEFDVATSDIVHDYNLNELQTESGGVQTVKIIGQFPHLKSGSNSSNVTDAVKLLTVESWGDVEWLSMVDFCRSCINVERFNASDAPDLSLVTDMSNMFQSAKKFNGDINHWDTSNIENMGYMFYLTDSFNRDLNNWDVRVVTNFRSMFSDAKAFNGDISIWQPLRADSFQRMFENSNFNGDISSWDTGSVTDMSLMFSENETFNQPIGGWDTSLVTNMDGMFGGASEFNQPLGDWITGNVTNMRGMFDGANTFNQDIGGWDTRNVELMSAMFRDAFAFDQDLSGWDVSSIGAGGQTFFGVRNMFEGAKLSTQNYDALLRSWSRQNVLPGNTFNAGGSQYSQLSAEARALLESKEWTIVDGGLTTPSVAGFDSSQRVFLENPQYFSGSTDVFVDVEPYLAGSTISEVLSRRWSTSIDYRIVVDRGEAIETLDYAGAVRMFIPMSSYVSATPASDIDLENNTVYALYPESGVLDVIDILDPRVPRLVNQINVSATESMMTVLDGKLYIYDSLEMSIRICDAPVFGSCESHQRVPLGEEALRLVNNGDYIITGHSSGTIYPHRLWEPSGNTLLEVGSVNTFFGLGEFYQWGVVGGGRSSSYATTYDQVEIPGNVLGFNVPTWTSGYASEYAGLAGNQVAHYEVTGDPFREFKSLFRFNESVNSSAGSRKLITAHSGVTFAALGGKLFAIDNTASVALVKTAGQEQLGQSLTFTASWNIEGVDEFDCYTDVDGGTCEFDFVPGSSTATVQWNLPAVNEADNESGHHELVVVAGSSSFLVTGRAKVAVPSAN